MVFDEMVRDRTAPPPRARRGDVGARPREHRPSDDAHAVAAEQIRDLLGRRPADGPVPPCVFDAGCDSEKLARALGNLAGEHVAVLVQLRSGRCFDADPDHQPRTGRPRRHGPKLACDDPTTW